MFRFERLRVWHKAVDLYEILDEIADSFPSKLRFSIADQLRRAALSVPSNIAEGSGRETLKESQHFFTMAKASTFEVVSIIAISLRRKLISPDQYQLVYERAEEISKMLTGLKRASTLV